MINTAVVMPLFIALTLYLLDKKKTENERKELERKTEAERIALEKAKELQVFGSLRKELEDTRNSLLNKRKMKFRDHEIEFTSKYLNHDIYDSLLITGNILYIEHKKQQTLQNITKRIKLHNKRLKQSNHVIIKNVDPDGKLPKEKYALAFRYRRLMQSYEQSLMQDIDAVLGDNN